MKNKLKAILIDDEENAIDVLKSLLIKFCPNIDIIATFPNIKVAIDSIKQSKPDVVFLDIEMPHYAGYEIVNFFDEIDFEIIFVTAFDNYAVKAFEVAAVDYLLKPIEIDRLKEAVKKLNSKIVGKNLERYALVEEVIKTRDIKYIYVNIKGYQYKINLDDIIAFEAEKAYSYIYTTKTKYFVSKNLKHYEKVLEHKKNFYRVHKSWIINMNHITKFSKLNRLIYLVKNIEAKLSKYKKNHFSNTYLNYEKV